MLIGNYAGFFDSDQLRPDAMASTSMAGSAAPRGL
jgi:hypothetical protein